MNDFLEGVIVGVFVGGFVMALAAWPHLGKERRAAHIEVASGQVKCELVEQPNKQTKWVCE